MVGIAAEEEPRAEHYKLQTDYPFVHPTQLFVKSNTKLTTFSLKLK